MSSIRKAVIADAGIGSRFFPLTKTIPKAMLPILNKPIMEWVVLECFKAGIQEVIIVVTEQGKPIYEHYFWDTFPRAERLLGEQGKIERYESVRQILDNSEKIKIISQPSNLPYGNASPLLAAKPFLESEEAFLMLQSDDIIIGEPGDATTLISVFNNNPEVSGIIMAQSMQESELHNYGVIKCKLSNSTLLDHIIERPSIGKAPSNLVSYGRYLLTRKIFDYMLLPDVGAKKEFYLVDSITALAKEHEVLVVPTEGEWVTTGDPLRYINAHVKYALKSNEISTEVAAFLMQALLSNPQNPK